MLETHRGGNLVGRETGPSTQSMRSHPQRERASLLEVRSLTVHYEREGEVEVEAVRAVDLTIRPGESVGVLGESGSGKSTLAAAIMGLLPPSGATRDGSVHFDGHELVGADQALLDRLRGDRLAMVFQEPGLALSPLLRVGTQISDVLRAHKSVSTEEARQRSLELLDQVRIERPAEVYDAYPHQLSGGQQQRVVIAQALSCSPALLVADEPTASLDTVTQSALVDLLGDLRSSMGMALLFVSHDPRLLRSLADRWVVMYAGRIVEDGPSDALASAPAHPYLRDLLRCVPRPGADAVASPTSILGAPPSLSPPPPGCAFERRCADRVARCAAEDPAVQAPSEGRRVACWNPVEGAR